MEIPNKVGIKSKVTQRQSYNCMHFLTVDMLDNVPIIKLTNLMNIAYECKRRTPILHVMVLIPYYLLHTSSIFKIYNNTMWLFTMQCNYIRWTSNTLS